MAEHRPFPPSVRRSALARAAGLVAASPILVGALACAAAVFAIAGLGRAVAAKLGAWVTAACEGTARLPGMPAAPAHAGTTAAHSANAAGVAAPARDVAALMGGGSSASTHAGDAAANVPRAVLELALPILVAVALAAIVAHVVQTRSLWLPRRKLPGAPALEPARVRRATLDLTSAVVVGAVAFGWLWLVAPRLAGSIAAPLAGPALLASFVATLAIAWVALGILDALVRHAEVAGALRMSHADKREDDRLAGADPRWRQRRAELARDDRARTARAARSRPPGTPSREAIAGSSVLVLGDDVAIAIAWDPVHRPVPVRTAIGRAARMTQLLGLARHHAIAVHRDPALARALVAGDGPGSPVDGGGAAVPEAAWPRLAEIIAATRGRGRSI